MNARKVRAAHTKIRKGFLLSPMRLLLSPMRLQVYSALVKLGPSTSGEITRYLSTSRTGNPSYHRRLSELARLGVVTRTRGFTCSVTGRKADVWQANGELPRDKMLPRSPKGISKEALYLGLSEIYFLIHRYRRLEPNYNAPQHLLDLCGWIGRRGAAMSARK